MRRVVASGWSALRGVGARTTVGCVVARGVAVPVAREVRWMSSKKAGRRRAAVQRGQSGSASKFKMRPKTDDPKLATVLKQFFKKVHPDLFGAWPELRQENQESMQTLNGLLEEMRSGDTPFPARRTQRIHFYCRLPKEEEATRGGKPSFMRVALDIKTTGADCRHLMGQSFHQLFKAVGLPDTFHWGSEFWEKQLAPPEYVSSKEYRQQQQAREDYEAQGRR